MLSGRGLSASFGGPHSVSELSIDVERGKATVLLGPSGSGKTTALRLLALLDTPAKGTVQIDQQTFDARSAALLGKGRRMNVRARPWPDVTVVFQQLFLWPHKTLRENIHLPFRFRKWEGSVPNFDAALSELAIEFRMEEYLDRHPNEVSLGQRRLAALARALILRPSYLLLDEITASLDVETIATVLLHLEHLKKRGIGLLIVTHHLDFAERVADSVVFLDKGRVVESGGPAVLRQPQTDRLARFLAIVRHAR